MDLSAIRSIVDTALPRSIPEEFQSLQTKLRDCWQSVDLFDTGDYDIVVIPSVTLDAHELEKVRGFLHYEERCLFSLIRLRNPRTRLIYITSQPLHPSIIDYYLQLLPGIPFSHARNRLLLFSTYDASPKALTQKILERPRLMERIRRAMRSDRAYAICYNATDLERDLSVQLGIPLFATDPALGEFGTKSGSRQIFAECQVPHPDGSPLVHTVDDLARETQALKYRNPELQRCVVKLNEGFSGEGNALLNLRELDDRPPLPEIHRRFQTMRFQASNETWDTFKQCIPELGAIVEGFVEGEVKRSPSVQGRINPCGRVEILSTHDQILGGPDGQIFLGCEFPAHADYRLKLQHYGQLVGEKLGQYGALERYGVDFVVVQRESGQWDVEAIEINLRKGGTTHPFMAMKLLTMGQYNTEDGRFYSLQGQPKYYKATDNLEKSRYQGLLPSDLMDAIAFNQLHFDTSTETGTVFHLMGCLSEFGKLGMTSIGNSREEAETLYQQVSTALDRETSDEAMARLTMPFSWPSA
ncbi:MAG: peptide ligase PGM1-related protein [Cyanophyceae cyanobacterium]